MSMHGIGPYWSPGRLLEGVVSPVTPLEAMQGSHLADGSLEEVLMKSREVFHTPQSTSK